MRKKKSTTKGADNRALRADAKQTKQNKNKASSFFELEAEASDDEEEGEDERGRKEDEQLDKEAIALMQQQDRRRAQAGGCFEERSIQEISRDIEQRHRLQNRIVPRSGLSNAPVLHQNNNSNNSALTTIPPFNKTPSHNRAW